MNLANPRIWIAFFSTAAISFVAVVDMNRASPGALTAVHGRERDLGGRSGCSECHGGLFSEMTEACLDCHAPIGGQIEGGTGLHGIVGREKALNCALCHSEHHGANAALVNLQSFARAGVPDPEAFDHLLVGFAMDGAHLELDCTECHANAREAVLPKGETRFTGLAQGCVSCHEDPHEGRFAVGCTSCHGQETWDQLHSIGHEEFLPLVGGHGAGVGCRACHAEESAHALEVLGTPAQPAHARECSECHPSPHERGFLERTTLALAMSTEAGCVGCHAAEHVSFRDQALALSPEQHALSGFALAAPHEQVACADCHAPDGPDFAARYPGRGPDECSRCHADPHDGQFVEGPFSQGDCIACHDRLFFEPHAFGVTEHAQTSLALTGSHLEADCNACHLVPEVESARIFQGTPAKCEPCHTDAHRGFFDEIAAELPTVEQGECARCHATTVFAELPAAGFDHERWTSFALLGAHAQGECETCHTRAAQPDDSARTFGRVDEQFGAFEGCVTCHADPHGGDFDRRDLPDEVDGATDCARCHAETSFRDFPEGFDHGGWTGFHLAGAHAEVGCFGCHEPLRVVNELGRSWDRALGALCADCHDDPHAGQFLVGAENDCERCHASEDEMFLAFDHDRDSRFPLDETHAELDCAACHITWTLPDGDDVVRYRPLGTECVDCHDVDEDVLLRRKRGRNP